MEDEKMEEVAEETAQTEEEKFDAATAEAEAEDTSQADVNAGSPEAEEEEPEKKEELDSEKFDESGVPWKNRAMESERKRLKLLEEKEKPKEAPPVSEEEYYEQIAKKTNLSVSDVPGVLSLIDSAVYSATKPLQDRLEEQAFGGNKEAAKRAVSEGKEDFSNLSADIDKELESLPSEVKRDPEKLKAETEKAYWIVKGKQSSTAVAKAESRVKEKVEQDRKIVSSQPDKLKNPALKGKKVEATADERYVAESMGMTIEEYLESKAKGKNGRRSIG